MNPGLVSHSSSAAHAAQLSTSSRQSNADRLNKPLNSDPNPRAEAAVKTTRRIRICWSTVSVIRKKGNRGRAGRGHERNLCFV
jgi:hypothetical protein